MFWKRKPQFSDTQKAQFVDLISEILKTQTVVASGCSIEDGEGRIKRKAIGYIYGFVDAALRRVGQDTTNASISVQIMYRVLRHVFPGYEERYTQFLINNVGKDNLVMTGAMKGGQQYVDFIKPDAKGSPMGLARYMIEGDER